MPLHKSEEGWQRLRERVAARQGVRAAIMDSEPGAAKKSAPRKSAPRKRPTLAVQNVALEPSKQPRFRNRRRVVVAFEPNQYHAGSSL